MTTATDWLDWVEDSMLCWALSITYWPEAGLCQLSLLHGQATEVGTLPAYKGSCNATSNRWGLDQAQQVGMLRSGAAPACA